MENVNENFNSLNEETFISELETLDEDARKEKILEIVRKHNETGDKNRQLFERAKKAEGDLKELKEKNPVKEPEAKPKPDEKLLERLDKLALKVSGISEADEVELFNKWKTDTGREADDIVGSNIFKKELEDLRTAKANQAATSDIQGGSDKTGGAKTTPDYWIAKATKGADGKLLFPEEMPKELYSKVLDKLSANEPGSSENLRFYDSK